MCWLWFLLLFSPETLVPDFSFAFRRLYFRFPLGLRFSLPSLLLAFLSRMIACSPESNPEADETFMELSEPIHKPSTLNKGRMEHGCAHYWRRCKIRAPCCSEIFDCRHCHNEAKAREDDPSKRHEIPRHKVEKVICSLCSTEQSVQQICESCGVCMGEYFCGKCKFLDDDSTKGQFHCDDCGICRVGGREKFFHCKRCGCCYRVELQDKHQCVENSMQHNCPVCFEYLFDSLKVITVLRCGHTMHFECLKEMTSHSQYTCPMCSKSVCDMSKHWEQLDREVAATPMPEPYQNKLVWILCNDCGANSEVFFHIIAQKCSSCRSYNTRQTKGRFLNNSSST